MYGICRSCRRLPNPGASFHRAGALDTVPVPDWAVVGLIGFCSSPAACPSPLRAACVAACLWTGWWGVSGGGSSVVWQAVGVFCSRKMAVAELIPAGTDDRPGCRHYRSLCHSPSQVLDLAATCTTHARPTGTVFGLFCVMDDVGKGFGPFFAAIMIDHIGRTVKLPGPLTRPLHRLSCPVLP